MADRDPSRQGILIQNSKSQINEAQKQISSRATKSSKSEFVSQGTHPFGILFQGTRPFGILFQGNRPFGIILQGTRPHGIFSHGTRQLGIIFFQSTSISQNFLLTLGLAHKRPVGPNRPERHKTSRRANRPEGHKMPRKANRLEGHKISTIHSIWLIIDHFIIGIN